MYVCVVTAFSFRFGFQKADKITLQCCTEFEYLFIIAIDVIIIVMIQIFRNLGAIFLFCFGNMYIYVYTLYVCVWGRGGAVRLAGRSLGSYRHDVTPLDTYGGVYITQYLPCPAASPRR